MIDQPLIFSASIGNGHHQAAKALQDEFIRHGLYPEVIDTFHTISPALHKFILKTYIYLLQISPSIWRKLYAYTEVHPLFLLFDRMGSLFADRLYALITQQRCPIIISTHPFVTAFLSRLKQIKHLDVPLYTIITDFVLHPAYLRQEIDGYFTAYLQVDEFAHVYQVPAQRFFSTGIPIMRHTCLDRTKWDVRSELGLDHHKKALLISGGGMGLISYVHVIRQLEALPEPIQLIYV